MTSELMMSDNIREKDDVNHLPQCNTHLRELHMKEGHVNPLHIIDLNDHV